MSLNILVTGTNSGFGRLIALTLAKQGHRVFATMRDVGGRNAVVAAELEKEGGGKIRIVEMGLTDEAEVERAVRGVLDEVGQIDVFVSNAGYMTVGLVETVTGEQLRDQFDVNVIGAHRVMRAILPSMRARGRGLVVQVSSAAGRLVFPILGTYGASKFALEALFQAYRYELKPLGVEVTVVQPGGYATDIFKRSVIGAEQERSDGYGAMKDGVQFIRQAYANSTSGPEQPDPQQVADAILKLVESPAGSRPARVVVDVMFGTHVDDLNKAHAETQKSMMEVMGTGPLAD